MRCKMSAEMLGELAGAGWNSYRLKALPPSLARSPLDCRLSVEFD